MFWLLVFSFVLRLCLKIISCFFFFIVCFHLCFIYAWQCPPPNKKNHFLGSFMFVVFMSATCMPKSYWANHLGQQSKPLPVGFFTPCSFPPLRHVCMPKSYSVNHLGQQSKPFRVGFFTPCWFPPLRHVCMPKSYSANHLGQQSKTIPCWVLHTLLISTSKACMSKWYSMNHLVKQCKPLPFGFSAPCWFPSLRHVCMQMFFWHLSLLCLFVKKLFLGVFFVLLVFVCVFLVCM